MAEIARAGSTLRVIGRYSDDSVRRLVITFHDMIDDGGLDIINFDFTDCTAAYASSMLPLCAQVAERRQEGIQVTLSLPRVSTLTNLFRNTNWAHFINPERYDRSRYSGYVHVPATQYTTSREQATVVNSLVETVLGAVAGIARSEFSAIEWALNEITDNVLVHSQALSGGFVQLTTIRRGRLHVQFVVCDAGIGIPASLRNGHSNLRSDSEALELAVREGVTRDPSLGQGNGLFGTYQITKLSGGSLSVNAGHARLYADDERGLHLRSEQIPYSGTVVAAAIDCSKPGVLEKALSFGGRAHVPYDYLEHHFESEDDSQITVRLKEVSTSVGSRTAGGPVRTKLKNVAAIYPGRRIVIDFDGVPVLSSSFADEVFAKLFLELGPLDFIKRFDFVNVDQLARDLIDRAIQQRTRTGL